LFFNRVDAATSGFCCLDLLSLQFSIGVNMLAIFSIVCNFKLATIHLMLSQSNGLHEVDRAA